MKKFNNIPTILKKFYKNSPRESEKQWRNFEKYIESDQTGAIFGSFEVNFMKILTVQKMKNFSKNFKEIAS